MSKSLKNFVTVREALETYSARQIRFLFLLHRYHEPMEYSANAMSAAVDLERRFASFDSNLAARLADAAAADAAAAVGAAPPHEHKWGAEERVLQAAFAEKRATVHAALLNAVDTPAALKALEQLVRAANTFVAEVPTTRGAGARCCSASAATTRASSSASARSRAAPRSRSSRTAARSERRRAAARRAPTRSRSRRRSRPSATTCGGARSRRRRRAARAREARRRCSRCATLCATMCCRRSA